MEKNEERIAKLRNLLAFVPGNVITLSLFRSMTAQGRPILPAALSIIVACVLLIVVIEIYFRQQRRSRDESGWGLSLQSNSELFFGGIGVGAAIALALTYVP